MQIRCAGCQKILRVTPRDTPIRVKCPGCGTVLQVPAGGSPPSSIPSNTPSSQLGDAPDDPFADLPTGPIPSPAAFPAATSPPQPQMPVTRPHVAPTHQVGDAARKRFPVWGYVAIAAAVIVISPVLCCGVLGLVGMSRMKGTPAAVMTEGLGAIPSPTNLPELGPSVQEFPSGVTMHRVEIRSSDSGPGTNMSLQIYMPSGDHAPQSVPCVLVAPAGTPLLHGSDVDGGDYHDETLPYSEAGMVVVHYSIDGAIPESVNTDDEQAYTKAISAAYPRFKESGGGIVNGRNALEYALAKIKIVDPQRICAAGHSSAGTLALMLAASEPRVTHCAAYAAAVDLEKRMADLIDDPVSKMLFSGVEPFLHWYSPINHVDDFRCNMLVFHARDDGNVPFEDATRFVGMIKDRGTNVVFVKADRGDHYTPMITEGIPAAIQWLGGEQ